MGRQPLGFVRDLVQFHWSSKMLKGTLALTWTAGRGTITTCRPSGGGRPGGLFLRYRPAAQHASLSKDAALARTVRSVRAEFANQKATKTDVLDSLNRSGALKRHPDLAIETMVDATDGTTDIALAAAQPEAEAAVLGLCIRVAWGPGKVKWNWSNPQASPYYYSYKPESATALKWASAPEDDLDAMYKRSWSACKSAQGSRLGHNHRQLKRHLVQV